jgi:hypothetical protein
MRRANPPQRNGAGLAADIADLAAVETANRQWL